VGKWEMVRLSDIVDQAITGEWGTECIDGEVGTKVLRTTNFTNSGVINYDNVVVRDIPTNKVKKKKLKKNDIILEKSGGSDNQPVGRVVFFENEPSEVFLCNNFTQVLRIEPSIAFSRYVFLYLFRLHQNGTTELLQNKTTGIRNLQIKQYMALDIPLPPLEVQRQIADVLDRASALIEKRKAQIEKLDLLIKSQFIEMFGDPVTNPMGWESKRLGDIFDIGSSKRVYQNEQTTSGVPFYRISDLVKHIESSPRSSELFISDEQYDNFKAKRLVPKSGDILVTSRGTLGQCYIINDSDRFYFQDGMISWLKKGKTKVASIYITYLFMMSGFRKQIDEAPAGSTVNYLSIDRLEKLITMYPDYALQNNFAAFVERVEAQKFLLQKSLTKLELNYKSLMQKCFSEDVF